MSFQTPITIRRAIEQISNNEYVLPAIQRELVWRDDQITRLFDSLMCGYPIGSFLFWKVDRERCQDYKFYGFLRDYHEIRQPRASTVDLELREGITAILDGQQRLTSLHIGLRGSYAAKIKHKRWDNPDAFPQRKLYLNLLQPAPGEDVELRYDFRFLTEAEAQKGQDAHWFPVGEVLRFNDFGDINEYLRNHGLPDLIKHQYAERCLFKFFEVICKDRLINYYQEEDQDLDKVLNIFIRVNSGGTQLSYSDLLLSLATAQWTRIDARKEIHQLVDNLNHVGGFHLNKDFVLKSCLVLADIADIGFKVKNFTHANTEKIEAAWPRISEALQSAANLAARFGYSGRTLTANNVLIPVAYYLLARGLPQGYLDRQPYADDRGEVRKWIVRALLKAGTFGSGLDTTLRAARLTIRDNPSGFPTQQMDTAFARIGKALRFEEEELDDLLDRGYGQRGTFSVLALLYPGINPGYHFHEDHIFPKSRFTEKKLRDAGIPEEQIQEFQERRDRIANLQLLEGTPNQEKQDRMPAEWAGQHFSGEANLQNWKSRNFIDDLPADMTGFLDFYEARREKMKQRLAQILGVRLAD